MCAVECDQYYCKNHEHLDYKGKHPKIGIPKTTKKECCEKILELINGHGSGILGDFQTQSCGPRVFTHNGKNIFDPNSKATDKQLCAIKRRYSVMEVSSPLFQAL